MKIRPQDRKAERAVRRDALAFLKGEVTGVVATAFDGDPHASTVHYVVDDKFNVYFVTKRGTNKYLNLALNDKVAFVTCSGSPATVSIDGKAEIVYEKRKEAVIRKIRAAIAAHGARFWPLERIKRLNDPAKPVLSSFVAVKIVPASLSYLNLGEKPHPDSVAGDTVRIEFEK